jgi:hypothetical protein
LQVTLESLIQNLFVKLVLCNSQRPESVTPVRVKHTQSEARQHLIDTYRNVAHSNDNLADELRRRADDFETQEMGHECGHLFTISATSIGHYGIAGEGGESHKDAQPEPDPIVFSTQVRAHSLVEACRKAAAIPMPKWSNPLDGESGAGGPAT